MTALPPTCYFCQGFPCILSEITNFSDCQAICKLTTGCEFWTAVPSDADPDAHSHAPFGCYLKYGSGWEMKELYDHVSGDKSGAIVWMNKGLPGGDMSC